MYGKLSGENGALYEQGKGNENNCMGIGFLVHYMVVSAGNRVEFVGDSVLYIVLRGRLCNIFF